MYRGGWLFYGVQSNILMLCKKKITFIFPIIYLYSTPLCPFSDKRADHFLLLWSPSLRNTQLVRCPSVLWLWTASSVPFNILPLSSVAFCIVNKGVIYISYQSEPDWDAEVISEEDHAEPVQVPLLMVCFFLLMSRTFRYAVICKCYYFC